MQKSVVNEYMITTVLTAFKVVKYERTLRNKNEPPDQQYSDLATDRMSSPQTLIKIQ